MFSLAPPNGVIAPAGTIAGMVPICTMSTIEVSRENIPAGLELEQLGVLPADGYQLRVRALLYHPAFVQH